MDENFMKEIEVMGYAALKAAYHSAVIEDDELGEPVLRPDAEKRAIIFARVAQIIAEDSEYDPENEPDFNSAAKEFLERE